MEEASKGKAFTFEMITVDENGRELSKQSGKGYQKEEDLGNGVKLEMVYIPAGNFMMGSPSREGDDKERPQHQVTFAQPFYLGKYPITQEQWQVVMGNNPSDFKGAKRPVENVTWDDAVNFCQKLSEKTQKTYRLPSAAWRFVVRLCGRLPHCRPLQELCGRQVRAQGFSCGAGFAACWLPFWPVRILPKFRTLT